MCDFDLVCKQFITLFNKTLIKKFHAFDSLEKTANFYINQRLKFNQMHIIEIISRLFKKNTQFSHVTWSENCKKN